MDGFRLFAGLPLLVLVAVFGTRFGLWSAGFGLEVLTLKIGRILAFAGLAAALVAVVAAFKRLYAVPAALLTFVVVIVFGVDLPEGAMASWAASLGRNSASTK